MPIPKPKGDETQNDYVSRCMSAIGDEYDTNEQAVAICISTYERESMSKITDTPSKVMASVKFNSEWRGINLAEGAEDPCQTGYKQLGTKEKDGRTVPNCIPEESHPDNK